MRVRGPNYMDGKPLKGDRRDTGRNPVRDLGIPRGASSTPRRVKQLEWLFIAPFTNTIVEIPTSTQTGDCLQFCTFPSTQLQWRRYYP